MVYKIDRLSRSLLDFARIIELLEKHNCSFVSVTQQFNTKNSMGRLTLNILLSFAQFEREIIAERTRDKIVAARKKGKWTGGYPVLGYDIGKDKKLALNPAEVEVVRQIYELYIRHEAVLPVVQACRQHGWLTKTWVSGSGRKMGGQPFNKPRLYSLLTNPLYLGKIRAGSELTEGEHSRDHLTKGSLPRSGLCWTATGAVGVAMYVISTGALLKGLALRRQDRLRHGPHLYQEGQTASTATTSARRRRKKAGRPARGHPFRPTRSSPSWWRTSARWAKTPRLQQAVLEETDAFDQPIERAELLGAMASFDPCWNEMAPRERHAARRTAHREDIGGFGGREIGHPVPALGHPNPVERR